MKPQLLFTGRRWIVPFFMFVLMFGQDGALQSLGERRKALPARAIKNQLKEEGHDLPTERKQWNLEWFGPTSIEYLDAINKVANQEVLKYRSKVPFPSVSGSNVTLTYPLLGTIGPQGGGSWTNIGPFGNLTDANYPDHDSGRVSRIAIHPNYPSTPTIYVATAGGGVFKCTNADPTTNSNWTWVAITDSLPSSSSDGNIAVGSIALDPSDASGQTLYVGLGDHVDGEGRGFWKTTNGGTSWVSATGIGSATRTLDILVMNNGTIFWATNDGLKKSTTNSSSAVTFVSVSSVTAADNFIWTIKAYDQNRLICTAGGGGSALAPGKIYYSADAGSTWTLAAITGVSGIIDRISVATSQSKGVGIFETTSGISKGLLVSTDFGANWTYQAQTGSGATGLFYNSGGTGDGSQDWYNQLLAIDPSNANNIFIAANLALYRSSDGGLSWQQMTHWYAGGKPYMHADNHAAAWTPNGQILLTGNDGGFAVVRDPFRSVIPSASGTTSVPSDITYVDNRRNFGLSTHLIYNLGSTAATSPTDSKYRVSVGLQDNGTRIRQASGGTGATPMANSGIFEDQIGGDGFSTVIHPSNGDLILGSLYYTRIFKSTNGGITPMTSSGSGIVGANNSSVSPFYPKMHLGNSIAPDAVYTQTNTVLYKSGNFGSSWLPIQANAQTSPPSIRNFAVSESNQSLHAIASASGTVYKARFPDLDNDAVIDPMDLLVIAKHHSLSSPEARKWADANGSGTVDDTDITATIGVINNTSGHIGTWTSVGGTANPALNNSWIWIDSTNQNNWYLASSTRDLANGAMVSKLYKSPDEGVTWASIGGASSGLPFGVPVHVIKNVPGNGARLFCGTDFGIYYSENSGTSWVRYGSGLPLVSVRDIYIAPDLSFIRVATYGRGVWEITGPLFTAQN